MNENISAVSILKSKGAGKKLLAGGLFSFLFFTVYFPFVVTGYTMNVLCSALEGRRSKLPDWVSLNAFFMEGLQPILISLAYASPIIALIIVETNLAVADLFAATYLWPLYLVLILLITMLLPLALIRSVVNGSLKAAFELGKIFGFIKNNTGRYLGAWVKSVGFYVLASAVMLSLTVLVVKYLALSFTLILVGLAVVLLIGCFIFFATAILVVYVFARAYRASNPFEDDRNGEFRKSIAIPPPLIK